jgi:hypothetical protein
MAKHAQGSKSFSTHLVLLWAGKRWVKAELRADKARTKYRDAYANRYGDQFRNPNWWLNG